MLKRTLRPVSGLLPVIAMTAILVTGISCDLFGPDDEPDKPYTLIDALDETIREVGAIIDTLRSANPNVTVLLAQLIPPAKDSSRAAVKLFNAKIPTLAASKTSSQSPVVVVDHFTPFSVTEHLNSDGVHPNGDGAEVMATTWLAALESYLDATDTMKIMPLGNSITAGTSGWECYRRNLDGKLKSGGYAYDLVGSQTCPGMPSRAAVDGCTTPKDNGAHEPDNYDYNHEGHFNWHANWFLNDWSNDTAYADREGSHVGYWAREALPDIVLLHLGTNDINGALRSDTVVVEDLEL